jgi:HEAT repeat protein
MTAAAVLFSVLYYSLYLPYARVATERFANAAELAGFFGVFWAAVTGAGFLVSILVTNRLFARFGVASVAVVLPVLYVGAFATVLVSSGFVAIVAVRFVTSSWLQGVASPGWETLINVVPEARRDQTRAFINGGPTQVGTAIAGLVALVGQDALSPRQFALIGLVASLLTVGVALAIRRSYPGALLDALRAWRPRLFGASWRDETARSIQRDAGAIRVLAAGLGDPDVHVRRMASELLAGTEPSVRPPELRSAVRDPDGEVRAAAVVALDPTDAVDREALLGMVEDEDPRVAGVASACVLAVGGGGGGAERLRRLLDDPDDRVRAIATHALRHAPTRDAIDLASARLDDPAPGVRAASLTVLATVAPERARLGAVAALRDADPALRVAAGRALGACGVAALDDVLDALIDPASAGSAIEAVRQIDGSEAVDRVRAFAVDGAARAGRYREAALGVPDGGPVATLLRDALLDRARRIAHAALCALTIGASDREAAEAAIENLDGDGAQVSVALETLESTADRHLVAPLLTLWEPAPASQGAGDGSLRVALADDDPLIRATAQLALEELGGGTMSGSSTTALSLVERVLHLRAIPLLAALSPTDLEHVAEFAEERTYTAGETIASEGELGDELHVVVDGVVRVVRDGASGEVELARRAGGDVIGELSLITREPRVASLVAAGDVRTIRIGHRQFESLLRERPDVALAVMRMLALRVAERTRVG